MKFYGVPMSNKDEKEYYGVYIQCRERGRYGRVSVRDIKTLTTMLKKDFPDEPLNTREIRILTDKTIRPLGLRAGIYVCADVPKTANIPREYQKFE